MAKSKSPLDISHRSILDLSIYVPVFTIFNDDVDNESDVNVEIIPAYATFLAEQGATGVLVNSTIGEGMSMSINDRKCVATAWAKAARENNLDLIIQVGGMSFNDVIDLTFHAETLHVNYILCLPDLFFKPTTSEQLIQYLEYISDAAQTTPLLYYHIPAFSNVNIHMGRFLKAVAIANKLPRFKGINFASANLEELSHALAYKDKFQIYFENDYIINAACAMGVDSFVLTSINIKSNLVMNIFNGFKNGDIASARNAQEALIKIITGITKHGDVIQAMKLAMDLLSKIRVGRPHPPLIPLSCEIVESIITHLQNS